MSQVAHSIHVQYFDNWLLFRFNSHRNIVLLLSKFKSILFAVLVVVVAVSLLTMDAHTNNESTIPILS